MKRKDTSASATAGDPVHDTVEELRTLVRDAESVLASAGDAADSRISELRERMRLALEDARLRFEDAREAAREQVDRADEYVRSHPYHAIGIAAAIGALAGVLLTRRLH